MEEEELVKEDDDKEEEEEEEDDEEEAFGGNKLEGEEAGSGVCVGGSGEAMKGPILEARRG